ncbi:MAG: phosphotyrosine protein phosphatase [Terracidiphilus sp.]
MRSPTAEAIFSTCEGIQALSAGTNPDAETPVSADLIEWADLVFAMENIHCRRLKKRFPAQLKAKKVVVLAIPDNYKYMDPELIRILRTKVPPHLKSNRATQA